MNTQRAEADPCHPGRHDQVELDDAIQRCYGSTFDEGAGHAVRLLDPVPEQVERAAAIGLRGRCR